MRWRVVQVSICLLVVISLVGCGNSGSGGSGGGTSQIVPEISPQEALTAYIESWKNGGGPAIELKTSVETQVATSSQQTSLGTIYFKDLSGNFWTFSILNVVRMGDYAQVEARYSFQKIEEGEIRIDFTMIRSEGNWKLDNIKVTSLPWFIVTANGLQGYVRDEITGRPIQGALVYLYGTSYQSSTDADGVYSFKNIPPGTYTIVVVRDGYVMKTIPGVVVS